MEQQIFEWSSVGALCNGVGSTFDLGPRPYCFFFVSVEYREGMYKSGWLLGQDNQKIANAYKIFIAISPTFNCIHPLGS